MRTEGQNGGVDEREQHQHRRLPLRRRRAPRRRIAAPRRHGYMRSNGERRWTGDQERDWEGGYLLELRGGGGRHGRGDGEGSNRAGGEAGFASCVQRCWFWESAASNGAGRGIELLRYCRIDHVNEKYTFSSCVYVSRGRAQEGSALRFCC